jgi:hypothetical protein
MLSVALSTLSKVVRVVETPRWWTEDSRKICGKRRLLKRVIKVQARVVKVVRVRVVIRVVVKEVKASTDLQFN